MNKKQLASSLTTIITGLGAFYLAISKIWNLPYGQSVSQTAFALVALVSAVLGAITIGKFVDVNNDGIPDDEEVITQPTAATTQPTAATTQPTAATTQPTAATKTVTAMPESLVIARPAPAGQGVPESGPREGGVKLI